MKNVTKFLLMALVFMLLANTANAADNSNMSSANTESAKMGKIIGALSSEHPDWFKQSFLEIAEDVEEANEAGKHVILYFHLEDCPYCSKMIEDSFKNSSYTDFLQERFDTIAINVKGDREIVFNQEVTLTEKELSQHLQVRYTPTLLFLNKDNTPVLRLNGYRSVAGFKYALDFVNEKAYQQMNLSRYIEDNLQQVAYTFRDHPSFSNQQDLSKLVDKPLMLMFEDKACDECDILHNDILNLDETKTLLNHFTVVRLDAHSEESIVDLNGQATTPKALAAALDISYRPGVVLFDGVQEIIRIDGMLRSYHFQEILRYVGERRYRNYPIFRDYMREREQQILSSGQNIDIWK